jgi:hypothetical protein
MRTELMPTDEVFVREISQWAVDHAPCITFGQFRQVAKQGGWSLEWLLEQSKGELDRPTETLRRIVYGAMVDGKHDLLTDVVLPYGCLIRVYQRAMHLVPAQGGERACECGCGAKLRGKQHYASPACRKRAQRATEVCRRAS